MHSQDTRGCVVEQNPGLLFLFFLTCSLNAAWWPYMARRLTYYSLLQCRLCILELRKQKQSFSGRKYILSTHT